MTFTLGTSAHTLLAPTAVVLPKWDNICARPLHAAAGARGGSDVNTDPRASAVTVGLRRQDVFRLGRRYSLPSAASAGFRQISQAKQTRSRQHRGENIPSSPASLSGEGRHQGQKLSDALSTAWPVSKWVITLCLLPISPSAFKG